VAAGGIMRNQADSATSWQELRVECFFPMDEATAATLRGWAPQS
jgi:hypothetical protein